MKVYIESNLKKKKIKVVPDWNSSIDQCLHSVFERKYEMSNLVFQME